MNYLGNGEGHTPLILTDAESRLIRKALDKAIEDAPLSVAASPGPAQAMIAFNRGIQRGTDKVKAEFDAIQKAKRK